MRPRHLAGTALLCAAASPLHAAPLDALLTALPPAAPARWDAELGTDHANRRLDVLGLRPKRADGTYGPSGVYDGNHLLLGVQATPDLRIDGALWKRHIAYVSVAADVTTWQLAGQWRMWRGTSDGSALALRASAWSNHAPLLRRTTSATVQGITFTSAQATNPRDAQLQVDLLATWRLAPALQASLFGGVGVSRVDFDEVRATTGSAPACVYDVQFTSDRVIATCEQNGNVTRISTPNAVYGIEVDKEARYTARSAQVGANAIWTPGDWRLRAGVQHLRLARGTVDDIVRARGGTPYTSNTIAIAEVGYRVLPSTHLFVRAQVLQHQFTGEAPLMYNTLTATQHRRRYGVATLGLGQSF
jgi:hypothetical protein